MAGFQEILTLFLILAGILFIPRLFPGNRKQTIRVIRQSDLGWRMRTGIVLTILVPLLAALTLKPWERSPIPFVCLGILPVILGWAGYWIWSGFTKSKGN